MLVQNFEVNAIPVYEYKEKVAYSSLNNNYPVKMYYV